MEVRGCSNHAFCVELLLRVLWIRYECVQIAAEFMNLLLRRLDVLPAQRLNVETRERELGSSGTPPGQEDGQFGSLGAFVEQEPALVDDGGEHVGGPLVGVPLVVSTAGGRGRKRARGGGQRLRN
jgi:hypothetical protein